MSKRYDPRGYGTRSPFQSCSGPTTLPVNSGASVVESVTNSGGLDVGVTTLSNGNKAVVLEVSTGSGLEYVGNSICAKLASNGGLSVNGTFHIKVNNGSGLEIASNTLNTLESKAYGSFDLNVPGVATSVQVLTVTNKASNSLNISATSNVINTVSGGVYEINGWIHHQLNNVTSGTTTGFTICNSSTGTNVLDCTWQIPSVGSPQNPACSCVTGFFTAPGSVDVRLYNAASIGSSYVKEGDVSIKRIA